MTTQIAEPEYVPSGLYHPDHRRVGGLSRKSDDSRQSTAEAAEIMGRVFEKRSAAAEIAASVSVIRATKKTTARARVAAPKSRRKGYSRAEVFGPTEERLAKGDIMISGGVHRSAAPLEKLRLNGSLDDDQRTANAKFFAGDKLYKHWSCSINGVRALDSLDLDFMPSGGHADVAGEEGWVYHHNEFKTACRLLGYYPDRPNDGLARIVIAVVCQEMSLRDAAEAHLPSQRTDRAQAIALDRLRSGLLTLAFHWKFL